MVLMQNIWLKSLSVQSILVVGELLPPWQFIAVLKCFFVQNVFVETHDLRFPEVAFFAQNFISAGTELTWDYNYEVGSVEGKVMYCYCDSRTCRGRLL
ncbi:histone-lysine N-methyltransferase SETDB1 [Caerostris extrusa]|uniref:Histone-lysine N-methyltransferase SETDB1 n=1 Tax=Caerostris extrusa TaxID=172846 RepID=A0AAV4RZN0_CAEEX|nr:histone-lysine N-methyltransferase SETDB1 [Caerostris extrusa]